VTTTKITLNHAEGAKKGAILVLKTTAVALITVCTYLRGPKRGRDQLVEKKNLTAVLTMMKTYLNHA
jgi:hypothetical protein